MFVQFILELLIIMFINILIGLAIHVVKKMFVVIFNVVHVVTLSKNHFGDFYFCIYSCQLILSNCVYLLEFLHYYIYSNNRECDIMIYPSIDKLLNIVDSKYKLVHIAARRSKQISRDGYLQMPKSDYKSQKNIGRALEEVSEGLIEVK